MIRCNKFCISMKKYLWVKWRRWKAVWCGVYYFLLWAPSFGGKINKPFFVKNAPEVYQQNLANFLVRIVMQNSYVKFDSFSKFFIYFSSKSRRSEAKVIILSELQMNSIIKDLKKIQILHISFQMNYNEVKWNKIFIIIID